MSISPLGASDFDKDGMSDIWQQQYSAFGLISGNDEDGDSFTNFDESIAGTDPFNSKDYPKIRVNEINLEEDSISLSFPTKPGKFYQVLDSDQLSDFRNLGPMVQGDGTSYELSLLQNATSTRSGNVIQEFWADVNVSNNDLGELETLDGFPDFPDGTIVLPSMEAPSVLGTGFGFRMYTIVVPPAQGDYTFFISSGSSARLYFSSDADPSNKSLVAQVLPEQAISPNAWDTFDSQRSATVTLKRGVPYYVEAWGIGSSPLSHCQIGWSGPDLTGVEIVGSPNISDQAFMTPSLAANVIFERNYDLKKDRVPLWSDTTIDSSPPNGMSGRAETIAKTQSNSYFALPEQLNRHIYLRFLVNASPKNDGMSLILLGSDNSQEGPRVTFSDKNGGIPVIGAGGLSANDFQVPVTPGQTYQVELLASLRTPFTYITGITERTVMPDRFDIYVTDMQGKLVGLGQDLSFRDGGNNVVKEISQLRAFKTSSKSQITFDEWHLTSGSIDGNGYINTNISDFRSTGDSQYFKLEVSDLDQDQDGLSDSDELILAPHSPFLFFDANSDGQRTDSVAAKSLLRNSKGDIEFKLFATDVAVFEDNAPSLTPDYATIEVSRTGALTAVTAQLCVAPLEYTGSTTRVCDGQCCTLIGTAGDEEAEPEDYTIFDEEGNIITNTLYFAFGEMSKTLTVIATKDGINEYPETLNIAIAEDDSYTISNTNGASIQIFDLPDSPNNYAIFTGAYSRDGAATTSTSASGSVIAVLNGTRTKVLLSTEFAGLSSMQTTAHVHKSSSGRSRSGRVGDIVYPITQIPGDPMSAPLIGTLDNYEWDLISSPGAASTNAQSTVSRQVIIDSLFGQNGETQLYFNVHTANNQAGEIWAFLGLSGGSREEPPAPDPAASPGSAEYPLLAGGDLEADVRRFLDQATFGATEDKVSKLLGTINTERVNNPNYHRHEAFENWMDEQMQLQQSYLVDFHLALDFQQLKLQGWFDPRQNPSKQGDSTPAIPAKWPAPLRPTGPNADPAKWHLSGSYPVTREHQALARRNGLWGIPDFGNRRNSFWQMMVNAEDQLRQKMGFALQQIVVTSVTLPKIRGNCYSSTNYQDMLNHYAFSHYRDVLGFVNWSPVMGVWLSSLQNEKGIDLDGDGVDDSSPDENLARENMQLFSIGLFDIWPDGTLRLGLDGAPKNTYSNEDIRQFAKILTGLSFSVPDDRENGEWGGIRYESIPKNTKFRFNTGLEKIFSQKFIYPMKMFGDYHDRTVKTFAGTTIDNTNLSSATEQGIADIEDAMDWLAGKPGDGKEDFNMINSHGSTPAFISLRLIQRFVKSNPSRQYLHRVATTFKDTEGHLGETIKAILLDPEARVLDINDTTAGMKKSSIENFIQLIRNLGARTYLPVAGNGRKNPFKEVAGDFSNPDLYLTSFGYASRQANSMRLNQRIAMPRTYEGEVRSLQMMPFYQDSVFNWYAPDFAPGGPVSEAGLVAPEMQITTEQTAVKHINYFSAALGIDQEISQEKLGQGARLQNAAFNYSGPENQNVTADHNRLRFNVGDLTDEIYPSSRPKKKDAPDIKSAIAIANLEVLDELDRRLTYGNLKRRYPINPSDDGRDGIRQNPRELILTAMSFDLQDPWDGDDDGKERLRCVQTALYLLVSSPEFQVRK